MALCKFSFNLCAHGIFFVNHRNQNSTHRTPCSKAWSQVDSCQGRSEEMWRMGQWSMQLLQCFDPNCATHARMMRTMTRSSRSIIVKSCQKCTSFQKTKQLGMIPCRGRRSLPHLLQLIQARERKFALWNKILAFVMVALLHWASNSHLFLRWIDVHVASKTGSTVQLSAFEFQGQPKASDWFAPFLCGFDFKLSISLSVSFVAHSLQRTWPSCSSKPLRCHHEIGASVVREPVFSFATTLVSVQAPRSGQSTRSRFKNHT